MIRKAGILASLMVAVAMAGQAKADSSLGTANIKLTGLGNGLTDFNLSFSAGGITQTYSTNQAFVGQINWSGTFTMGGYVSNVAGSTFCVQGLQDVYVNQTYNYDIRTLGAGVAPVDLNSSNVAVGDNGALSASDAMNIQGFADKYLQYINGNYVIGNATYDKYQASAAFQLAVWELEYDGLGKNFGTGYFTASAGANDAEAAGAITLAKAWLASFTAATTSSSYVLESPTAQDQVYFVVNPSSGSNPPASTPLPAALPAGIGMLGALIGAKKLRRKTVAA